MAEYDNIFVLDDDETEDVFEQVVEDKKEELETVEETEETTPDEVEEQPEEEQEPEEKPEPQQPKDVSPELVALLAKKDEENRALNQQVVTLAEHIKRSTTPDKKEELTPLEISQDEYDEDPVAATQRIVEHNEKAKALEQQRQQEAYQSQQAENEAVLRQHHERRWNVRVKQYPALRDNPEAKQMFISAMKRYVHDPSGIDYAVEDLETDPKFQAIVTPPQDNTPPPETKPDDTARKQRVRQSVMHGSGKTGSQTKVELTQEHRDAARKFDVSPEVYIETLNSLKAAQGGEL